MPKQWLSMALKSEANPNANQYFGENLNANTIMDYTIFVETFPMVGGTPPNSSRLRRCDFLNIKDGIWAVMKLAILRNKLALLDVNSKLFGGQKGL